MSELENPEAVDVFNNPHPADAIVPTDKDPEQQETESNISRTVPDTLVEIEEVVHELHARSRALSQRDEPFSCIESKLPVRLCGQIRKLLSKGALGELPTGNRQAARLKILEAIGECLADAKHLYVIQTDVVGEVELCSLELEALYRRRLESSAALGCLSIRNASEKWEPGSWQLLADMLLRAESLHFEIDKLSLSGPSKLEKAVAASGSGPLPAREISICYGLQDLHRSEGTTERFIWKWAAHVANLIAAALSLKRVRVVIGPFAVDESVGELIGEAIASHQSLETLVIEGTRGENEDSVDMESDACGSAGPATSVASEENKRSSGPVGRLLSRVFLHHRCSVSINSLIVDLKRTPSTLTADLEVLTQVLQMSTRITEFDLVGLEYVRSSDLRGFLTKLQVNGLMQLQSLGLQYRFLALNRAGWGFDRDSFSVLVELLNFNSMSSLKHLEMYLNFHKSVNSKAFNWSGFYSSLSQMESVSLGGEGGYGQAEKEIMEWIQGSKRLQKLDISRLYGNISWKSIFERLRENTALRILAVSEEALEDDAAYRKLMEMLQVNSTLQEINFPSASYYGDSSRRAAVREALRSKARQESYLAELRNGLGQAEWQNPKCGRVFLCGSPEAGKTRLTLTMLKVVKKKLLLKRFKEWVLPRTKGVEIHTLKNDGDMQILVWDLAGQDMFRALQQFLFPRLSRASVFIFVFSPFEPAGELKPKLQDAFENELLVWLRFIASNSAITSLTLPQVMVVISHEDKYLLPKKELKWCDKVLTKLIHKFEDIIHIHPAQFFIDGHEPQHVKPILEKIYSIFHGLFQGKLFRVPLACSQLSQQLVRVTSRKSVEPVIDDATFFNLCRDIPDLRTFSNNSHEDTNKKLLKAIGSYLHDVGTVIDMPLEGEIREKSKSSLMVVDPNWLTHVFLGHFISLGHEGRVEWKGCEDGVLSETDFQQFLFKRFKAMRKKFPNLTSSIVQDLMENLDLLYVTEIEDQEGLKDSRFFIPTLVIDKSEQALEWANHGDESSQRSPLAGEICFFGMRLCCKDRERTYLSSAFFSRFQVMIWRKLTEELKEKKPVIMCKLNLISILVDGLHILVENDEDGDFIDILIRSTKTKRTAWNFAEEYIMEEVQEFCASPKGCPGVELVMHIIRTDCVKFLTPCKDRKNQSVSRKKLRQELLKSIQKVGPSSEEKDLYWHTWESVPRTKIPLGAAMEKAVELLPHEDIDECIKSNAQSLQEKVIRLEDTIKEIDIANQIKSLGTGGVQTNLLQPSVQMKLKRSKSEQFARPMHERFETLMREIHLDLKRDVGGVSECVKEVLAEMQDLKIQFQELIHLQKRAARNVRWIYQKLEKFMGHSMATKEWPNRPYFTHTDVSLCHKITAVVDIGKPLMLHFECEEKDKSHFIPDQPGYRITVGKKNREALRWISKTSVQIIWYLLKAGVHISTGMGDIVPELQTPDGNTSLLTSLSMTDLLRKVQLQDGSPSSSKETADPCSPEDAWKFLQDFIQKNLKDHITEYFLLHPAQYLDNEETHAWLCQRCLEIGLKGKKLRKL